MNAENRSQESNPVMRYEKRERYLCAMPLPLHSSKPLFPGFSPTPFRCRPQPIPILLLRPESFLGSDHDRPSSSANLLDKRQSGIINNVLQGRIFLLRENSSRNVLTMSYVFDVKYFPRYMPMIFFSPIPRTQFCVVRLTDVVARI